MSVDVQHPERDRLQPEGRGNRNRPLLTVARGSSPGTALCEPRQLSQTSSGLEKSAFCLRELGVQYEAAKHLYFHVSLQPFCLDKCFNVNMPEALQLLCSHLPSFPYAPVCGVEGMQRARRLASPETLGGVYTKLTRSTLEPKKLSDGSFSRAGVPPGVRVVWMD